jgi:hypothetical protein
MDVAMAVRILRVKRSGDDATVRERRTNRLAYPRANF